MKRMRNVNVEDKDEDGKRRKIEEYDLLKKCRQRQLKRQRMKKRQNN